MHWQTPEILLRQLQALDDARFVALCNEILSASAARARVPRECLALNLNVAEPDGGVDAQCHNAPTTVPRLISRANVDYQFKGGRNRRGASAIAEKDILEKPRVVEDLREGYAFVYMAAWERGTLTEKDIQARLNADGLATDDGQIVFIGGEAIVQLLASFPALVTRFLGVDASAVFDMAQWALFPTMENAFQADASLNQRIEALRSQIEANGSLVRVVGAAGDGKTRLVLEALKRSELAPAVLYAAHPSHATTQLLSHLIRTPDISCTLVIDEVDDAAAAELENRLAGRPDGLRVVFIGLDAQGGAQPDTLQVEGLDEQLLAKIILSVAEGIDQDVALGIARDCERSPKLAVLIARRIREDRRIIPSSFLRDASLRRALDRYIPLGMNEPEWQALSIASLLTRLGWSGELENESNALFTALGLDPIVARRQISLLHERYGIAPTAGRYRYISPAILADHLAVRQLSAWTRDDVKRVMSAFTPAMAESFAKRARRIAAALEDTTAIEEALLGEQGPFRDLNSLEHSGLIFVLRRLAGPFPWATLRALERSVGDASHDELLAATQSRRELVWAVDELLWRKDTFPRAAELLLKLAISENETWANSASGLWTETFQTWLGRTEAGWESRSEVLWRASRREEPAARVLVAKAIEAAFRSGTISRSGNPPRDVEGMPSQSWGPTTHGEMWDSMVAYLDILERLLGDDSHEVRRAAVAALGEASKVMVTVGTRVLDRWREVTQHVVAFPYEDRRAQIEKLEWTVRWWSTRAEALRAKTGGPPANGSADEDVGDADDDHELDPAAECEAILDRLPAVASVLEQVKGSDFSSRLRTTLTRQNYRSDAKAREEAEKQLTNDLGALAAEALRDPEVLSAELEWLATADSTWRRDWWVDILAQVDTNRVAVPILERLATVAPRAVMWRSIYEVRQAALAGTPDSIDVRAAQMHERKDTAGALDLLVRAGYTSARVAFIIGMLREKSVTPSDLASLAYTAWLRDISPQDARELFTAALEAEPPSSGVVHLLTAYLHDHPHEAESFSDMALRVLTAPIDSPARSYPVYEWSTLADRYVELAPEQVGKAILQRFMATHSTLDAELHSVLEKAWEASDPTNFFDAVVAPTLLDTKPDAYWARQALHWLPIQQLGSDFLLEWVKQDPDRRALLLADAIGPPYRKPYDLHAGLLERYGQRGVGGVFYARFMSGSFTGSAAAWMRGKIETARGWLDDEHPAIRAWAAGLVADLEKTVKREEQREAEERFEY
jgi:hypothetical protein